MNYTITGNPYRTGVSVQTNGVGVSSKVAKINHDKSKYEVTKKEKLIQNWEALRPKEEVNNEVNTAIASPNRNYNNLLSKIGISSVEYGKNVDRDGAKKLRVNEIVNKKTLNVYENSDRVVVTPIKEEVKMPEVHEEPKEISVAPKTPEVNNEYNGRHEKTAEIPVQSIQDAIRRDEPVNTQPMVSRAERNAMANEMVSRAEAAPRQEPTGGDVDLYNSLLHNDNVSDVSKQLQGARNQLILEKEENKKLAEQYGEAVRELEELKKDIERERKAQELQVQNELNATLKDIAILKEENLAKTSDLTSIQGEIARLKAQRREMETSMYDSRSMGRAA